MGGFNDDTVGVGELEGLFEMEQVAGNLKVRLLADADGEGRSKLVSGGGEGREGAMF